MDQGALHHVDQHVPGLRLGVGSGLFGFVFLVLFFGIYHGKSLSNHHLGLYFLLFPGILSKSGFTLDDLFLTWVVNIDP